MRLNKEFFQDILDLLDDAIKEVGYPNPIRVTLPNGIEVKIYNQYPHVYRLEIRDLYKRPLAGLIFNEDQNNQNQKEG